MEKEINKIEEGSSRKTLKDAIKSLQTADRMLTMTYPLVKDEKLLVAVLDNIYLAASGAINAILENQREQKKIPPYQKDLDSKMNMMRLKVCEELKIDPKELTFIEYLKELVKAQRNSNVKFSRNDQRVFLKDEQIKTLSKLRLETHIQKAKNLVTIAERVLSEN